MQDTDEEKPDTVLWAEFSIDSELEEMIGLIAASESTEWDKMAAKLLELGVRVYKGANPNVAGS